MISRRYLAALRSVVSATQILLGQSSAEPHTPARPGPKPPSASARPAA